MKKIERYDKTLSKETGKVYLAGGGCGDPELLTLRAVKALQSCDVVVYDSLVAEELLRWTKSGCEKIYVGKRYGSHAAKQSEINGLLVEKARAGKTVVRLKGGDPYVFGRGGEEFLALREAGISCEEIPGISSAIAVPAAAGIPLTHRGLSASVTVVTGTAAEADESEQTQEQKPEQVQEHKPGQVQEYKSGQVQEHMLGQAQADPAEQEGGSVPEAEQAQEQKQELRKTRLCLDFDTLVRLDGTLVILMGMHHLKEIAEGLLAAGKSPDTPCAVVMEGTTSRQRCLRTVLGKLYGEAKEQGFTSPAVIVVGAVAKLQLTDPEADMQTALEEIRQDTEKAPGTEAAATPEAGMDRVTGVEDEQDTGHRLPLAGVTVGVTGTAHFAGKLAAALEREGAETKDMSFMEVRQMKEPLPEFGAFVWLVFTSPNGVRVFLDKMRQERRDLRSLYHQKIAVIGPGTASVLEENGMYADYMPDIYDVEHLARGLSERIFSEDPARGLSERISSEDPAGGPTEKILEADPAKKLSAEQGQREKVIFLRAEQGSDWLPLIFREKGIPFVDHPLYKLGVCEEKRRMAVTERTDYIVFGSAMGVRAWFSQNDRAGEDMGRRYVCIGEKCGEELGKYTADSFLTAASPGVEAIVTCIKEDHNNSQRL